MDFELIETKVKKALLSPRILLSKFRFVDEQSRYSRSCLDNGYLPFYYYLGVHHPVKNLLEIGFGIGLASSLYLMGCKSVENYLTIQEPLEEYYSSRIGRANVKQVYRKPFHVHVGKVYDETFVDLMKERKWDLVIINEKTNYDTHLSWLSTVWEYTDMIAMDFVKSHEPAKKAYRDFCIIKNRESYVFGTRYGVGVITK